VGNYARNGRQQNEKKRNRHASNAPLPCQPFGTPATASGHLNRYAAVRTLGLVRRNDVSADLAIHGVEGSIMQWLSLLRQSHLAKLDDCARQFDV
jgi:hypothetical protein